MGDVLIKNMLLLRNLLLLKNLFISKTTANGKNGRMFLDQADALLVKIGHAREKEHVQITLSVLENLDVLIQNMLLLQNLLLLKNLFISKTTANGKNGRMFLD